MTQFDRPQFARTGNFLLDLLPEADLTRLLEHAQRRTVPIREVLVEAGQPVPHAQFPLTNVLSAIIPLRDGSAIEAATVGKEGMAGIDLPIERPTSVYRVIGQIEGECLQVPAKDFRALLAESRALAELVNRYTLTVVHQSGQNAACNLRHGIEERMCRWLLLTHDRVQSETFYLTQEFLGIMLGVQRQTVSMVASTLQEAGLIKYNRGSMKILNRSGLEDASCECYEAIKETHRQVMGIPGK